ncbi:MAG: hypothetical protein COA78_28495 [Blastopirellula sp.]|nr:MAG: hypothetical protein COA78_28495 [Blastopirellula sp.]
MVEPIIRKHNRKIEKICIKCREWKKKDGGFGKHDTSSDGYQSICTKCKGSANKSNRVNNIRATIRHHTATRCLTQLGDLAPEEFTKNIESYLGYRISELVDHLRSDLRKREGDSRKLLNAIQEGYHIDHIFPLSKFPVIIQSSEGEVVDWEVFRKCWAITNLSAIPAAENLAKGAKLIDLSD